MARTGISIQVSNTVLGSVPRVNANSMLVVVGATATADGDIAFTLDTPYMLQSMSDLETLGITEENNADLYKQVQDFYSPKGGINTTGTILWIVAPTAGTAVKTKLADYVRSTVINGFQYRPRNILVSQPLSGGTAEAPADLQASVDELYVEGFATVVILGSQALTGAIETIAASSLPDLSSLNAAMVGMLIVTNRQGDRPCVGALGGYMATLSVGTSIGDGSDTAFSDSMFFVDPANTPCSTVKLATLNTLGDKQYIFTRTRPPANGLWWNDGATCVEATTALSTLENGRTVASIVDDLREFFRPYINGKVPVNSSGDIQGAYKQVVTDNARSKVILPYIESGDISDARVTIVAQDNSMTKTRTWECTLELLDAPTLRWVDGYVFYVSALN